MANVILKNISGSSLSLKLLAETPAATLSTNQTINLLQYVSLSEATKSLQTGELKQAIIQQKISITKNSIGFIKKSDATISLSIKNLTATFKITPTSTSFSYNQQVNDGSGNLSIETRTSSGDSINITLISGKSGFYFIYYNNSTLNYEDLSTTSSVAFSDILHVSVCFIWYDANTGTGWLFDQRQESYTDWSENLLIDNIQQIKYKSGLQLTNTTNCQVQLTSGTIIQNTSETNITSDLQTLNPLAVKILYKKDSTKNKKGYDWTIFDTTSQSNIVFYKTVSNDVGYNNCGETGWDIVTATSNYYIPYWIVATNCSSTPIMIIMGQEQFSSLKEAQYHGRFDKLVLENFIFRSFKPLYRLIIKNSTTPTIADVTDLRNETLVADYISTGVTTSSSSGGTLLPDGTETYQHIEWDGGSWENTTNITLPATGKLFTNIQEAENKPFITYNQSTLMWEFSHDGVTSSSFSSVPKHNDLSGLSVFGVEGGYYHLSTNQATWLVNSYTNGYWETLKGGTGNNSYTKGDILYASETNVLSKRAIGTTGQVLTVSNNGLPVWETASASSSLSESVLVSSVQSTNSNVWVRASTKPINNSQFSAPTFYAVLERSSSTFNIECKLYNRTTGADVTGSLLTIGTTDLGPIKVSASITLDSGENLYDVLYHITTTTPGVSDTCAISFAGLTN